MDSAQRKGARRRKNAESDAQQLALPLFEPLVDHGLQQIHPRPWVSGEDKYRRGRRPAPEAWDNWPYVETHPLHGDCIGFRNFWGWPRCRLVRTLIDTGSGG